MPGQPDLSPTYKKKVTTDYSARTEGAAMCSVFSEHRLMLLSHLHPYTTKKYLT